MRFVLEQWLDKDFEVNNSRAQCTIRVSQSKEGYTLVATKHGHEPHVYECDMGALSRRLKDLGLRMLAQDLHPGDEPSTWMPPKPGRPGRNKDESKEDYDRRYADWMQELKRWKQREAEQKQDFAEWQEDRKAWAKAQGVGQALVDDPVTLENLGLRNAQATTTKGSRKKATPAAKVEAAPQGQASVTAPSKHTEQHPAFIYIDRDDAAMKETPESVGLRENKDQWQFNW